MLPAQYRMTRSAEFGTTVRRGARAAQSDLVVHRHHDDGHPDGPRIGLVVAKSVGTAVVRHRVARKLRHVARAVVDNLDPCDRVVIRALPGSAVASSPMLDRQLRAGLDRAHRSPGARR
ncbi:ribonuclease P protein component [Mycolicibacterium murale]|uniref:ribonuclease P protein component n=1 Tax=Mycolicibacterium murale TaxID=182220 RepID=UPI001873B541|nr:ribonuclease P protein component [Mycolicibacterium murale]MCV7182884.1 ribonuclease P protein component [Mycolicibacterium murale]